MIGAVLILLACQLAGEALVRLAGIPVPGPVAGLVLLLAALALRPAAAGRLRPVAAFLHGNMGLLFVPAGVGVVGHLAVFREAGAGLAVAVVVSTLLAIAVGAAVFAAVARATGAAPAADERK